MTASIQTKGDRYYTVIRYKDNDTNKWCSKWVSLGLSVSGCNKRKAEQRKYEVLAEWSEKLNSDGKEYFSSYLTEWVESVKSSVSYSTYVTYKKTVVNVIAPYFKDKKIKLCDLKPFNIQDFYEYKMNVDGVTASTIHHYHANISLLLNNANTSMKELQEWAGHSTFSTTADIYSHVQTNSKTKLSALISGIISNVDSLEIR